jgi:hypothetical protein
VVQPPEDADADRTVAGKAPAHIPRAGDAATACVGEAARSAAAPARSAARINDRRFEWCGRLRPEPRQGPSAGRPPTGICHNEVIAGPSRSSALRRPVTGLFLVLLAAENYATPGPWPAMRLQLLVRLRSTRVFYRDPAPRRPGQMGAPPRHGAEFSCSDPARAAGCGGLRLRKAGSATSPWPKKASLSLAAHIAEFGVAEITLPWHQPRTPRHRKLMTFPVLFRDSLGHAVSESAFNASHWGKARRHAGVAHGPYQDGPQGLRHYYASVLLAGGVDIKALSEYLGHKDAAITLRVCSHLLPGAGERVLKIIDEALAAADSGPEPVQEAERDPGQGEYCYRT